MAVNPNDVQRLVASQGLSPRHMVQIPTEAEKAEAFRVRDMQVRTQAAAMATQLLAARQTSQAVWDKWAYHIESYIREGLDAGTAPLHSRR